MYLPLLNAGLLDSAVSLEVSGGCVDITFSIKPKTASSVNWYRGVFAAPLISSA